MGTITPLPVRGPAATIPVIHAVTADDVLTRPDFLDRAAAVMAALGPRGAVHLRGPRLSGSRMYELASALAIAQKQTGCWVVVNDRVDVALSAGARGVQLTSKSMRPADARMIAPKLCIGASVHLAVEAKEAEREGADWVVAGHVFATRSHPGEPGRGEGFIDTIAHAVKIPVIAIGGILPEHVPALREAGAYGVAVIRGIWGADPRDGTTPDDAERAAIDYLTQYDAHGGPST